MFCHKVECIRIIINDKFSHFKTSTSLGQTFANHEPYYVIHNWLIISSYVPPAPLIIKGLTQALSSSQKCWRGGTSSHSVWGVCLGLSEDRSPKIPGFRFQSSFSPHHNLEVNHPMFRQTCGQLQVFHFPGGLGGNESRAAPGRNSGSRFEEMVQQIWDSCVPTNQFSWEPYCHSHSCFNLADHPGLKWPTRLVVPSDHTLP